MTAAAHPACTHLGYALTCAEFDLLSARAAGCCERCATPAARLQIDHDHALGGWAVRGLVCHTCNSHLRLVDSGRVTPSARDRAYLDQAWHLTVDTTARQRRARPRGLCPTCGLDCALNPQGLTYGHWSRVPGMTDTRCPGGRPSSD